MKRIFTLIATVLAISCQAYAQNSENMENFENMENGKTLVAYFSATGTTERVAEMIASATGGKLFEIAAAEPYTSADLDWNDRSSRSSIEMNDGSSRPAIRGGFENVSEYDVIYLGFPIWWNLAPRIINTFLETYGLDGKTVIPFATSGGSGINNSVNELKKAYPSVNWQSGKLLNRATETGIREWLQ